MRLKLVGVENIRLLDRCYLMAAVEVEESSDAFGQTCRRCRQWGCEVFEVGDDDHPMNRASHYLLHDWLSAEFMFLLLPGINDPYRQSCDNGQDREHAGENTPWPGRRNSIEYLLSPHAERPRSEW